ncbi:hypothetical protein [Arenibaculum pallidiluteum]|uniref:hypothetical protein n=1 Tax=Arenibaculum pallidiluteum TaxID=2812559 RepID=UPI001A962139|nr:hypothetical protein [Arenibaculum pallidiluteum]
MKTLSTALIAAALLGAAPAVASDIASGQNLFHGSTTLRSYAARDTAVQAPVTARQATAPQAAASAATTQGGAGQDRVQVAGTDFLRPYAH